MNHLNKVFLFEFIEFASTYKSLFIKDGTDFPRDQALHQLESVAKNLFDKYFSLVKSILQVGRLEIDSPLDRVVRTSMN